MSRGPTPVAMFAPDMIGLFDAMQKGARKVMDAAQLDQDLFDGRFGHAAQAQPLVPVTDAKGTMIASVVSIAQAKTTVNVILLTSATEPQHWRIDMDGFVVARKDIADRSEWTKTPEGDRKEPTDGAWMFTSVANEQIVHNKAAMQIVKGIFAEAQNVIKQIADEVTKPEYVQIATNARNARLGLSFVEEASNQIDVGQLMGRFSRGDRASRP